MPSNNSCTVLGPSRSIGGHRTSPGTTHAAGDASGYTAFLIRAGVRVISAFDILVLFLMFGAALFIALVVVQLFRMVRGKK